MPSHIDKSQGNKKIAAANEPAQRKMAGNGIVSFIDNRPESEHLATLQEVADNSSQTQHLRVIQAQADNGPQAKQGARLQALASAQGTDIHMGEGKNQHLPHEAGHDVQQKSQMGARPPVLQPKWIDDGGPLLIWDKIVEGVQWYYDQRSGKMFYSRHGDRSEQRDRSEWVKLYGSDPLAGEDASVSSVEELSKSSTAEKSGPAEAGDVPIIVRKSDGGKAEFTIKGLINCVGVVIMVYGGMDHIAAIGGHFNTPTMYDRGNQAFTSKGTEFIHTIQALMAEFDRGDLEASFIVAKPALSSSSGLGSAATVEATSAAELIKATLGIGGEVAQGSSSFHVSI